MIQDVINANVDYIFSINLSKKISIVAEKLSISHISWTVDTPAYSLYDNLLQNKNNIAFIYDYNIVEKLRNNGFKNVFYMPVGVNVDRLDKIKVTPIEEQKYFSEVSFLGSTDINNDFNKYISNSLTTETNLKIQKIFEKQFLNENKFITKDMVDDDFVYKIKCETGYEILPQQFLNKKEKLAILLGRQFNQIQRVNMIKTLSKIFHCYVYGDTNWSNLNDNNIIYKGYAEHFYNMPKVFKCSKININQTRIYVDSGLPMRIFDVLGSRGFLVTNHKEDIDKYFVDGKDLVIYRDTKDLRRLLKLQIHILSYNRIL